MLAQRLRSSRSHPSLDTPASQGREYGHGGEVSNRSVMSLRRSRTDSPQTTTTPNVEWRPSPKAQQLARSSTIVTTSSTTASIRRSDTISDIDTREPSPRTPFKQQPSANPHRQCSNLPESAVNEELPHQLPPSRRPFKVLTEAQDQRGRSLEQLSSRQPGFLTLGELPKPAQPLCCADRERSLSTEGGMSEEASRVDASDFNLFVRQTCMNRSGSNLSSRFNRSASNLSSRDLNRSASNLSSRSQRSLSVHSNNSGGRVKEEDLASNPSDRGRQRVKRCPSVREGTETFEEPMTHSDSHSNLRRSCSDEAQGLGYHKGSHPWHMRRSESDGVNLAAGRKLSLLPEDADEDLFDSVGISVDSGPKSQLPLMQRLSQSLRKTIGRSQSVAEPAVSLGVGVVIFDWDDTLLPTSYIKQVVIPSLPVVFRDSPITSESPYYNDLCAHAKMVEALLRAANKVATIAIVTLATKWWVQSSAERYLPGLDFEGLLSELDLVIYPADRQSAVVRAYSLSGRDPCKFAKKVAMSKCLKNIYRSSDLQWNVLSVGDSIAERDALKECLATVTKRKALCKTVKVRENLKLVELTKELSLLIPHLKTLVSHKEDFDRPTSNLNVKRSSWLKI